MSEIIALFTVFSTELSSMTLRQFLQVVFAMLAMTGWVTMLNISRWTSKGGSYRTIQRFFNHKYIPGRGGSPFSVEWLSLIMRKSRLTNTELWSKKSIALQYIHYSVQFKLNQIIKAHTINLH